jgi:hypothetical protein
MLWRILKGYAGNPTGGKFVRYFEGTKAEALEQASTSLFPVLCSVDETRLYYTERRVDELYQMIGGMMATDMPEASKKRLTEIFHTYEVKIDAIRKAQSQAVIETLTPE